MNETSNSDSSASPKPQTGASRKKETEDFELRLTLNKSEMECLLSLHPRKSPLILTSGELISHIKELGIVEGIIVDAVVECCRKLDHGHPVQDVLAAMGTMPEKRRDAALEFLVQTSLKPVFTEDKTGHVDFHETHLFNNVLIGHEIAILHPAVTGKNGWTVTGKPVPAAPPRESPVRAGEGVRFQEDDNVFVATENGHVIFKNNILQVSDEYIVEDDLDFHTGNLHFEGRVHVRGDVLDGFLIQATKDIRIDKNAGHCRFECRGNMEIGGMNGLGIEVELSAKHDVMPHPNTTGTILCMGNLTARYLHHVYVECEGNLHVTREIMHSVIRCAGTVTVDGRIVGGTCTALAGIQSLKVGTEIGIPTELIAGEDYREAQQETGIAKTLDHLHRERETMMQEIGPGPFTPGPEEERPHHTLIFKSPWPGFSKGPGVGRSALRFAPL